MTSLYSNSATIAPTPANTPPAVTICPAAPVDVAGDAAAVLIVPAVPIALVCNVAGTMTVSVPLRILVLLDTAPEPAEDGEVVTAGGAW